MNLKKFQLEQFLEVFVLMAHLTVVVIVITFMQVTENV